MTRQDYLVLKLALQKGWLEPGVLRQALEGSRQLPIVERLVRERQLSAARATQLKRVLTKRLAAPEPEPIRKRKDLLFRRFLIEGKECGIGLLSKALAQQRSENGSAKAPGPRPIGEILVALGALRPKRFEALNEQVDSLLYRKLAGLLCGEEEDEEEESDSLPQLADFECLDEIGRGGMGIIFRARQKSLDRIVALKVLDPNKASRAKIARFRREANALSRLRHPNIVAIMQVGEEEGLHFFAMELVEGETLEQVLDRGQLPLTQRLELLGPICDGVAYAHGKDILHRDLKPANIILDGDGSPKIADFGLARDLSEDTMLTRDGAVLGTPYYMSPEQIRGQRAEIGPHTDQFALGILIYEAVTGELPFHGTSAMEVYHKIMHEEPVPVDRMVPEAPDGLALLIHTALAKHPADRYPDVASLAADIHALIAGRPISLRPPGPVAAARTWLRRNRKAAMAGGLALLMLLTGLIWWRNLAASAPPGPVAVTPQPADPTPTPTPTPTPIPDPPPKPPPSTGNRIKIQKLLARAENALAAGHTAAMHQIADELRQLEPDSSRALMIDAQAYWREGKPDRVLTCTSQAVSLTPELVEAHVLKGRALFKLSRHQDAYAAFTDGLKHDRRSIELLYNRADVLRAGLRRPAEALADLTELLEIDPDHLDGRYVRGLVYHDIAQFSKAAGDFTRYLARKPQYGQAWWMRAQCYEREGKHAAALSDYIASLEAGGLSRNLQAQANQRIAALRRRLGQ